MKNTFLLVAICWFSEVALAIPLPITFLNDLANKNSRAEELIKNSNETRTALVSSGLRALKASVQTTYNDLQSGKTPRNWAFEVSSSPTRISIVSDQATNTDVQVLGAKKDFGILMALKYSTGSERANYLESIAETLEELTAINERIAELHRNLKQDLHPQARFVGNSHFYSFVREILVIGTAQFYRDQNLFGAIETLIFRISESPILTRDVVISDVTHELMVAQEAWPAKPAEFLPTVKILEHSVSITCLKELKGLLDSHRNPLK